MFTQLLLVAIIMLLLRVEHHLAFLVSHLQSVPATAASPSAASLPPSPVIVAVEPLEAPVPHLPVEAPEPPVDDVSLEDTPTDPVDTFQMTIQYHLRTPDQAVQYLLDRSKLRFTTRRVGGEEHAPLWQGRIRATMPDNVTVVDITTPVMAGSKQCRAWAATTITSAF